MQAQLRFCRLALCRFAVDELVKYVACLAVRLLASVVVDGKNAIQGSIGTVRECWVIYIPR